MSGTSRDIALVEHRSGPQSLLLHRWPGDPQPPTPLPVSARSRLAACARERITACQIRIRHVNLDGVTVVITARRESGTDTTTWTGHLDQQRPNADLDFTAAIDRLINEIRTQAEG